MRWDNSCPECKSLGTIAVGKPGRGAMPWVGGGGRPILIDKVAELDYERLSTGTREFDRVLGGGLVTGSTVLISGDPGIGKSTLLLQVCKDMTSCKITIADTDEETDPLSVLYVSAEETNAQIKGRGVRLDRPEDVEALRKQKRTPKLYLLNESSVDEIVKYLTEYDPDVLVIDSIQTMQKDGEEGIAGSVQQVRASATLLVNECKARGIGCFLVAHINKDGVVAGPKTLEHLVDAVLEFHKESADLRSVRASKNRFGDTSEMALFRMTKEGLMSVENPGDLLLEHRDSSKAGVSIGLVSMAKSSRPFAMEIQTLFGDLQAGAGKKFVQGLAGSRANQVFAVLGWRYGIAFLGREIFVNVPGDHEEVVDPAVDLPLALALASGALGIALPKGLIAWGEVGLGGEIRQCNFQEARIRSAALMGFSMIMGPKLPPFEADLVLRLLKEDQPESPDAGGDKKPRQRYYGVSNLEEAFDLIDGFDIEPKETKVAEIKPPERRKRTSSPSPARGDLKLIKNTEKDDEDEDDES
jgi:DNA repair protein RadA/Sms